jgi:hypothetical protein
MKKHCHRRPGHRFCHQCACPGHGWYGHEENASLRRGGQGSQAAPTAHAEGTIKALDLQSGKITLAHGPVAELKWPAMTMASNLSLHS